MLTGLYKLIDRRQLQWYIFKKEMFRDTHLFEEESLDHYTLLLKAHRKFKEIEPRWRFYDTYMGSRDLKGFMFTGVSRIGEMRMPSSYNGSPYTSRAMAKALHRGRERNCKKKVKGLRV